MKPALYLFVNKGLGMSGGKIGAQVAQATFGIFNHLSLLYNEEFDAASKLLMTWWEGPGHHHAVYVMEARDSEHLYSIERYLQSRGFKTYMMIDEGMTEIKPITPTVLAVEIVDKDDEHVAATFSVFKLYNDRKPAPTKKRKKLLGVL